MLLCVRTHHVLVQAAAWLQSLLHKLIHQLENRRGSRFSFFLPRSSSPAGPVSVLVFWLDGAQC